MKPQRNICIGSSKPSGAGDKDTASALSADVSLVASGVGKGCTPELLKEFLAGKGIKAVEVEMLTRREVLEQVRTLTFRVSVTAADYEAALKPEVWPYRVGVRHYRAPKRPDTSWQGQLEQQGGGGGDVQAQGGRHRGETGGNRPKQHFPPGHPSYYSGQQGLGMLQPGGIDVSNFFSVLAGLGNGVASPRY